MAYKTDYTKIIKNQLNVFSESRKRRIFAGTLTWDEQKNIYEFRYDPKYAKSKTAIPVGKELDLFKKSNVSKGKLFPSFADRIPSRENPAYEDYCRSQGIDVNETNQIVLLVSIGKRGPSTFIFEPIYQNDFSIEEIKKFRADLNLSINDMSLAFDLNPPTLHRLESGKKTDLATLRRLQIYLKFPKVAMWQLTLTVGKLHTEIFHSLWNYFEKQSKKNEENTKGKLWG